ncbi:MAG: GNAT family N-acetyltransferase, partial [Mycobacteriales bacterium]
MTSTLGALESTLAVDVLLRDGSIARVRVVTEADRGQLMALNERVSVRTRYLRYFSVSDQPGAWYVDRVLGSARSKSALAAVMHGEIVALASFARLEPESTIADLALLVDDDHQVHGLGALLLEHLAALGRHQGVESFTADVLSENIRMLRLLRSSGFTVTSLGQDSVAQLHVDLTEIPAVWEAIDRREREAERASLRPVLEPASIALVGSARPGSIASLIHDSLRTSGYAGPIERLGRQTKLTGLPLAPDLVVVAVPSDRVLAVARDAAACGARGLVVISAGFAESGPAGRVRQAELLQVCRTAGMRLIGPNCLGIVNT